MAFALPLCCAIAQPRPTPRDLRIMHTSPISLATTTFAEQNPQEWTPRLPTTSTYAWVTSVDQDGSFLVQETPGSRKYRAKKAQSCPGDIRRGDLVYMVTDGYFHYALSVLHRRPTPCMKLISPAQAV